MVVTVPGKNHFRGWLVWFGSQGQVYVVVVKASQEEVPNECTKEHSVDEQYRRILINHMISDIMAQQAGQGGRGVPLGRARGVPQVVGGGGVQGQAPGRGQSVITGGYPELYFQAKESVQARGGGVAQQGQDQDLFA